MRHTWTIVFILLLCSGCGAKGGPQQRASARPVIFEVVTVEEQAKAAVAEMPTEFGVPIENDTAAWSRARYFLNSYTESGVRLDEPLPGGGWRLSNYQRIDGSSKQPAAKKNSDRFEYLILKKPQGDMLLYRVLCRPGTAARTISNCQENARNVARFISEGNLELSLLKR
ncbi:MAG: hypothetical protein QY326_08515 [Bdellovibrionota bacterium]|nr:MAG: hypothetical protein QY326_08515 [Bdellovibrionota bacterium]